MQLKATILFAKDLERMTAFYRDGLGLRVILETREDGWVELDAGGTLLALHAIPTAIAETIDITAPPRAREGTPLKLVFETDDVAAARVQLIAHGAVMFEVRPWGSCDGLDPEGNVFQLVGK